MEIMDQFSLLLPKGKCISCFEDLAISTVKELKKVLLAHNEKVSGVKADSILWPTVFFLDLSIKKAMQEVYLSRLKEVLDIN